MGETSRKIRSGGRTVTSLVIHIAQGEKSQHKDPGFTFTCVGLSPQHLSRFLDREG